MLPLKTGFVDGRNAWTRTISELTLKVNTNTTATKRYLNIFIFANAIFPQNIMDLFYVLHYKYFENPVRAFKQLTLMIG